METTYRNRLKDLLEQAIALPAERRFSFLDEAIATDGTLRLALESNSARCESEKSFVDGNGEWVARSVQNDTESCVKERSSGLPRYVSHFRVIEELGGGGMGIVYKARDTRLDRLVALKLPHPHPSRSREARTRLLQEAKAASALDHPNIATIYETGSTEPEPWEPQGRPFIAMAYYAGETIETKIERGPLSIYESLNFAYQTCLGLSKAHEHGITHRDIKPANLIVTHDGVVKIVDFGLAKFANTCLTKAGTVVGTPAYMSPEQSRGDAVDSRTDVWSLGVVFYEMLTGQRAFAGEYEQAIVYNILNVSPVPVATLRRDVPPKMHAVVNKCLEKNPENRYQTAAAVQRDLLNLKLQLETKSVRPLPSEENFRTAVFMKGVELTRFGGLSFS